MKLFTTLRTQWRAFRCRKNLHRLPDAMYYQQWRYDPAHIDACRLTCQHCKKDFTI